MLVAPHRLARWFKKHGTHYLGHPMKLKKLTNIPHETFRKLNWEDKNQFPLLRTIENPIDPRDEDHIYTIYDSKYLQDCYYGKSDEQKRFEADYDKIEDTINRRYSRRHLSKNKKD